MFARGFAQSHLGERIAYLIVRRIGGSPLGLGYAIVCADLVMAPMTPSNTARAGGILFPITLNVARAFGSEPGPTAARIGQFLMLALFHGDLIVSAMFLTATAPNPLVAELARQSAGIEVSWTQWAMAAAVPGAASLVLVPWVDLPPLSAGAARNARRADARRRTPRGDGAAGPPRMDHAGHLRPRAGALADR